nr:hypothetical protein OG999_29280 [Streptomyces sp. NBC_00886]
MRPVTLNPAHVPSEIRVPLEEFQTARAATAGLAKQTAVSSGAERAELQEQHDQAAALTAAAYTVLEDATRTYGPLMQQTAAGAYFTAIERARTGLAEAETLLREAAQAAALHASIRYGKGTVNTDNERADRSKARAHVMRNVSGLRDLLSDLPEGLDD